MDVIQINDLPDMYTAMDEVVAEMDSRGLSDLALSAPITVVLKTNGKMVPGQIVDNVQQSETRGFNATAYINATDTQIINHMEGE